MTIFTLIISVIESLILYPIYGKYSIAVTQIKISSVLYALSVIGLSLSLKEMKISSNNIFVKLGDVSYGIFYIHIIVLKVVSIVTLRIVPERYLVLQQFLSLFLTLLMSYFAIVIIRKILKKKSWIIGM